MGPLGWQETVFIFLLALLLFGPKKLPELGKTIGKALTEFRRASSELKATWDREMSGIEKETQSIRNEVATGYDSSIYDYSHYESSYYDSETQSYTSHESNGTGTSTVSADASQGAETQPGAAPDGTVATTAAAEHCAEVAPAGAPAESARDAAEKAAES